MNLLLDTCVWGGVKAELQAAGHDVFWTGDLARDPGDEDILCRRSGSSVHSSRWIRTSANWRFGGACRITAFYGWSTFPYASRELCVNKCLRNMVMN